MTALIVSYLIGIFLCAVIMSYCMVKDGQIIKPPDYAVIGLVSIIWIVWAPFMVLGWLGIKTAKKVIYIREREITQKNG